jgi:hypothetical protein
MPKAYRLRTSKKGGTDPATAVVAGICESVPPIRLWDACRLTHRELAKRLRVTHSLVHNSESAERRVDVMEFADWCTACGRDPLEALKELLRRRGGRQLNPAAAKGVEDVLLCGHFPVQSNFLNHENGHF